METIYNKAQRQKGRKKIENRWAESTSNGLIYFSLESPKVKREEQKKNFKNTMAKIFPNVINLQIQEAQWIPSTRINIFKKLHQGTSQVNCFKPVNYKEKSEKQLSPQWHIMYRRTYTVTANFSLKTMQAIHYCKCATFLKC